MGITAWIVGLPLGFVGLWVRRLGSCGYCFDLLFVFGFVFLLFLWLSWIFFQRRAKEEEEGLFGFLMWNSSV